MDNRYHNKNKRVILRLVNEVAPVLTDILENEEDLSQDELDLVGKFGDLLRREFNKWTGQRSKDEAEDDNFKDQLYKNLYICMLETAKEYAPLSLADRLFGNLLSDTIKFTFENGDFEDVDDSDNNDYDYSDNEEDEEDDARDEWDNSWRAGGLPRDDSPYSDFDDPEERAILEMDDEYI